MIFFSVNCRKYVKNNNYGRQEEIYVSEDCSKCPYLAQ